MGLLSSVADQVIGDGDDEDDGTETFSYRCAQCGTVFDRDKTRMIGISCPECGSKDVRAAE